MIKSFKHKGLEQFFKNGIIKGIKSEHIKKLRQILAILSAAEKINDVQSAITLRCHALKGNRKNTHAVWVNKNWRVTFSFENENVYLVNYEDYHDSKMRR